MSHVVLWYVVEEWRPVPDWPYEVSSDGRVRSLLTGRVLAPARAGKGYHSVTLCRPGERRRFYIHHLVLLVYVGPRPDGLVTRHLDGDPTNNHLGNLAYGTQGENMLDRFRHGLYAREVRSTCRGGGHLYDEANTYVNKSGYRMCRACNRERHRTRRLLNRSEQ